MVSRYLLFLALCVVVCLAFLPQSSSAEVSKETSDAGFSPLSVEDPYGKGGKGSKGGKGMKPMKPMKPKMPHMPHMPKPHPNPHPKNDTKPHMPHPPKNNSTRPKMPPIPHVKPQPIPDPPVLPPVEPVQPVQAGTCSGTCQDNSLPCGASYQRGLCPGAANIQCCPSPVTPPPPATGSDSSVFNQILSQHNTKVSVGSYTGVSNGFYQTSQGALVWTGKMDTDCDGAPSCPSIDPYGQTQTSFTYAGKAIDALKTNYFVLPSDLSRKLGGKYKLGDIAAVMYNGHVSYAVYADNGPLGKAGEGSVHLSQELGFNPYCGSKICRGISSGVSFVVFPGSRSRYSSPYDASTIAAAGSQLLRQQVN
jgi:hypothetical protein